MKDLKTISKQQFLAVCAATVAVALFLFLPPLQTIRISLSEVTKLPVDLVWVPIIVLLLGFQYLTFKQSEKRIGNPFARLAQFAERGEQGFAFKNKSFSREEDTIKHAIEAANLRAKEAQEQADDLEEQLAKTQKELASARDSKAKLTDELEKSAADRSELRITAEKLKASKLATELTLENERKSKVGIEVEKRTEEIYHQMERAVSAAALNHIWIPSTVQEFKTPATVIHETASHLCDSWQQSSLTQVNEQIGKIRMQSELQLELLNNILSKRVEPLSSEPATVSTPPDAKIEFDNSAEELQETASQATEVSEKSKLSLNSDVASVPKPEAMSIDDDSTHSIEPGDAESEVVIESDESKLSPYNLHRLLDGLVEEFQPQCPLTSISCEYDKDLDIEIEDDTLLALIHSMVESAVSITKSGDIIVGVELKTESIAFDVACNGTLAAQPDINKFAQAEQHARNLNGAVAVTPISPSELHLSFEYSFADTSEPIEIDAD